MKRARSRRVTVAIRIAQVLAAMALALGLAELGFRHRDGGAFPHLRCYLPDPELGLRLEPGRVETLRFGGAAATTVRINREGLRGPEPAAPGPDEILVLGDSQAFGLGVEEEQTFSAVLATTLGRSVVNAGVPTYGPLEYARMAERRLDARPARTVVLLLAFQNDFFEADRPNAERHAAWDGWAVRKESAPTTTLSFPGRLLLYRESHLVYALRRALHDPASAGVSRVASGGTVADFLPLAEQITAAREATRRTRAELEREAEQQQPSAQPRIDADSLVGLLHEGELGPSGYVGKRALLRAATAHPGDIVEEGLGEGEEGLSLTATASVIAEGARLRARLIERWWEQHGAQVKSSRDNIGALRARLDQLRIASNPIAPSIQRIAERCKQAGANLVVIGLPTDTMVTAEAFAKYGEQAIDMSRVEQLADDLRLATEAAGGTWVDLLPTLQPLGLGAFLPKEFHLSVAGHAAVAARLAALLPRLELPRPSVPAAPLGPFAEMICEGCSADIDANYEVDARGVIELDAFPLAGTHLPPNAALSGRGVAAELQPGEQLLGTSYRHDLTLRRSADGTYHLAPKKRDSARPRSVFACDWEARVLEEVLSVRSDPPRRPLVGRHCLDALPASYLALDSSGRRWARENGEEALRTAIERGTDQVLACATGDATFARACEPGQIRVGPASLCRALCDEAHPCEASFACVPYRGAHVCAPPLLTDPTCLAPPAVPSP